MVVPDDGAFLWVHNKIVKGGTFVGF